MIKRYAELRDYLPDMNSTIVDSYCLSPSEIRHVDKLLLQLESLDSVTKELQREITTMSDVRALFDGVIEEFPDQHPFFESGIVKIQTGNSLAMSSEEKSAVQGLVLAEPDETGDDNDNGLTFAERVLKRRRMENICNSDTYSDTTYLIPTSNVCERLFSRAGYMLNEKRSLTPANAEAQLFLHMNQDLWSVKDVNKLTQQ